MKHLLKSYSKSTDVSVESRVTLTKEKILLHFKVKGKLEAYQFSQKEKIKRANELWRATCFELFLANSKTQSYYEINISPTLSWNIYYLEKYRAKPKEIAISSKPMIVTREDLQSYEIEFELECKELDLTKFDQYNLAVILLNKSNEREFWAINPVGKSPDFHDRGGFVF